MDFVTGAIQLNSKGLGGLYKVRVNQKWLFSSEDQEN